MRVFKLDELKKFNPEKMGKVDVAASPHMMSGLNCFEPGQAQKVHAHAGSDKLYVVMEGAGEFTVGAETRTCSAGELIYVPEDVTHGVVNDSGARLVILIVIAPNRKA